MKSVLISIQPKWCELIASGKKTIEVRKTKPKLDTPFKCYIYCTKPKGKNDLGLCLDKGISGNLKNVGLVYKCNYEAANQMNMQILSGKVIGEFVCDDIYTINKDNCGYFYQKSNEVMGIGYAENVEELFHCIPDEELTHYLGNNVGYGWHISNLIIYDKPRKLSEFKTLCTDFYDGKRCEECEYFIDGRGYEYDESDCGCDGLISLKRPPQSWCYVESEVDTE